MFRNGRYVGPWMQANDPAGGGGNPPTPPPDPKPNPEPAKPALRDSLTEDQRRELDSQIAAARRQAETDARTKFDADAAKVKADADVEAKRLADIAKGDFETVKASLEGERDTFKVQAETEKSRADKAVELLSGQVADRVKELPTAIADQFPKDADVLDQIAWLDDPRTKAVIETAQSQGQRLGGTVIAPRPAGSTTEQERVKQAAQALAQNNQYTPF